MFDKLFDLPAHPLLIHAPIVLLPIAAIVTVVLAAKPVWRARAWGSWAMVGALFVTLALLFAAKESGEAFNEGFEVAFGGVGADKHESLANTTFIFTLAWFVAYTALIGYEFAVRRAAADATATDRSAGAGGVGVDRPGGSRAASAALSSIAAVLAILATVWLIRTGHEGARITWGPVVDQLFPEG